MSKGKYLFTIPWNYNEAGFEMEPKEQILFDFMMREKLPFGIRCEDNQCLRYSGTLEAKNFDEQAFMAICKETAVELAEICNCCEEERYHHVSERLKRYMNPNGKVSKTDKKEVSAATNGSTNYSSFFGL